MTALLSAPPGKATAPAFGRLYDRYARMVHGILLSRVPPPGSGWTLSRKCFWRHCASCMRCGTLLGSGAWLAVITRNRANDYYRKFGPEDGPSPNPFPRSGPKDGPNNPAEGAKKPQ